MLAEVLTHHDFPAAFKGPVMRPGDEGYAEARQLWNMRLVRDIPALIVQPLDAEDVVAAVAFANEKDITIAVRSGGHGIDGSAMPHDALVIDTTKMKHISFDPVTEQATLQSGVLLGEMDAALQEHGYVVPAGVVSDTGVAGLTLGGGVGHLARQFGATVDNLVSIDVVTIDGRILTASATSNPELFWGMRGAGHNLAIATSFTFTAHKLGPQVISGQRFYLPEQAALLCEGIDDAMTRAPRSLSISLFFKPQPPIPGLPPESIGAPLLIANTIYTGPAEGFDDAMKEVNALATPHLDMVRPNTWVATNSMIDAYQPMGRRYYSAGAYVPKMSGELAKWVMARCSVAPPATRTQGCLIGFPILGGALLDADEDSAAFSRIGANWVSEIVAMWESEDDDDAYMNWVLESLREIAPYTPGTGYINLSADQGHAWLRGVYGSPEKWERIVALKREWDPDNRLAHNKNVLRAAEGVSVS